MSVYVMELLTLNKFRFVKNLVTCSAQSVYSSDVICDACLFSYFIFFIASLLHQGHILYCILKLF